jgi:hypothetical protein
MTSFERFYLTRQACARTKTSDYVIEFIGELATCLQAITYTGFTMPVGTGRNNGGMHGRADRSYERVVGKPNSDGCMLSS